MIVVQLQVPGRAGYVTGYAASYAGRDFMVFPSLGLILETRVVEPQPEPQLLLIPFCDEEEELLPDDMGLQHY